MEWIDGGAIRTYGFTIHIICIAQGRDEGRKKGKERRKGEEENLVGPPGGVKKKSFLPLGISSLRSYHAHHVISLIIIFLVINFDFDIFSIYNKK